MHLLAAAALALSTLFVPPDPVTAELRVVIGSGCPEEGLTISVARDNSSFTLRSVGLGEVYARSGPGTTSRDERKLCQIGIRIRPPQGWTYALGDAEHRGAALLERGATGRLMTQAYFQGMSSTHYGMFPFTGPDFEPWVRTDRIDVAERVYHPCGPLRDLNLSVEVWAKKGTSDPRFMNYFGRNAGETTYGLHWKKCP